MDHPDRSFVDLSHRITEGMETYPGLPGPTIARARALLETLAVQTEAADAAAARTGRRAPADPPAQLELFRSHEPHPVVETLRGLGSLQREVEMQAEFMAYLHDFRLMAVLILLLLPLVFLMRGQPPSR